MGVIETASDLAKLAQKLGNIEVYERVIWLQSQVMELIGANMSRREETQPLKEELRNLNDKTEITKSLKHQNNNYYTVVAGKEDRPFCTLCWDVIKDWSVCLAIRFQLEEHVTAVIIAVGREALRALLSLMFEPRVIVGRGFSRAITGLSPRRL